MTAAALLVVLGAALAMELGGLSMAMGAFVAGVMLQNLLPPPIRSRYRTLPWIIARAIFYGRGDVVRFNPSLS